MLHADVLGERARLSPDRVALVVAATGERLTYAALDRRARRLARAWLERLGLSAGDRVGLLAHNRLEFVEALFAAAKSGVILVPLSTRATANELAAIVTDAGLRTLVYDSGFTSILATLAGQATPVERRIALDPGERARPADDTMDDVLDGVPDALLEPVADPEHPVCLLYTSGTTGRPKGVVVPHRMMAWNAYNTAICWQLREDDVTPVFTPLYHAGGLGAFLLPVLAVGGTVVLHGRFDIGEVLATIARERCTVVLGVPTIFKMLHDDPSFARADLTSVRWFISGGAPLPAHLVAAYHARGVILRQGYGLTEVGVNCFAMSSVEAIARAGSIGRPLMYTRAKLVDDRGAEVGTETVGELCLAGPHVSRGYWNAPDATALAFDGAGWFHTGDLARRDADGFYTIVGRRKDMIISGGVNVYPVEVEAALASHPDVSDVAVVGVPHETWGEVGAAFVVRRTGSDVGAEALLAHLGPLIARFKHPRDIVFVDALPRTPYGKVVKDDLRRLHAQVRTR